MLELNLKTCTKCKKELPLSAFHKNFRNSDRLQSMCKMCRNANARNKWKKDKIKQNSKKPDGEMIMLYKAKYPLKKEWIEYNKGILPIQSSMKTKKCKYPLKTEWGKIVGLYKKHPTNSTPKGHPPNPYYEMKTKKCKYPLKTEWIEYNKGIIPKLSSMKMPRKAKYPLKTEWVKLYGKNPYRKNQVQYNHGYYLRVTKPKRQANARQRVIDNFLPYQLQPQVNIINEGRCYYETNIQSLFRILH